MSLPFYGIIAEVGVQVTPVLVVSVGMIISLLLMGIQHITFPKVLVPYVIYILLLSICMSFLLPDQVQHYPLFRGRLRWVSQLFVFFLLIAPIIYYFNRRPSVKELVTIGNVFIWTAVFLCLTGLFQLYIYNTTGKDIFPINLFSQIKEKEDLRSALSKIGGNLKIFRVNGIGGGEPKHFGYTSVIAFNLHIINWIFRGASVTKVRLVNIGIAILFLVSILLSLSTQSYLLLAMDVLLLLLLMLIKLGFNSKRLLLTMGFVVLAAFVLLENKYSSKLIEARIYERLLETGAVEDFNETIMSFIKDEPGYIWFGTGLGNVHFWAYDYIPKEFRYYMQDSVFVAKAGILRIVSEQGIAGLLLFLVVIMYILINLWKARKSLDYGIGYIAFCFLIMVIMDYFVSSDSSPYYVFAILFGFSVLRQKRLALS